MKTGWMTLVAALIVAAPGAAAAQAAAKGAKTTCTFVSYDVARNTLTVRMEGVPAKKPVFVAAVLDKGPEGRIWVQAGKEVKEDGEVRLEAYEFLGGKASILKPKSRTGKRFLIDAQKAASLQKPIDAAKLKRAPVEALCSFEVPGEP